MLNKVTALVVVLLLCGFGVSQAQNFKQRPVINGDEVRDHSQIPVIETFGTISFDAFSSGSFVWDIHNITDAATGYDLQSNASTQQVYVDPNNPDFIHAVFVNSQETATWNDRTSLYFGSTDKGVNWFELGGVPITVSVTDGRGGFPCIDGTSGGAAVIANHNNSGGGLTTSRIYIDASPFEYNFTEYMPGPGPVGDLIWPRIRTLANDDVAIISSQNGGVDFFTNLLSGGVYSGWQLHDGSQAEDHSMAVSDGGILGLAYEGQAPTGDHDMFYKQSTDGGLTWSTPITIYDADVVTNPDSLLGTWRGVSMNFYGEEPCVTFELGWVAAGESYYPQLPSSIAFWSPNVNGGVYKIIADDSQVPFYTNELGNDDASMPMGKPVIGRSATNDYLFVAFASTSGEWWPGANSTDSTAYYTGWFMYSTDGGDAWTDPENFTPATPLLDWRYPSIVQISPVQTTDSDVITVHMVMQGDSLPGSTVNTTGTPVGVTAQYYHFSTEIIIVSADEDPVIVNEFNLEQNYPNPFNPSTQINYTLAERSIVTVKVYDVLGNEIATLVNATQEAGAHDLSFDASQLSSGLYIYKLNAGNFTSSKKMMLLK